MTLRMPRVATLLLASTLLPSALAHSQTPSLSAPVMLPGNTSIAAAAGQQLAPSIARGGDQYLVVWADQRSSLCYSSDNGDQSAGDIFAARLAADGTLIDTIPIAISTTYGMQSKPLVSWNGENWLVAWEGETPTPSYLTYTLQAVRVAPSGLVIDPAPLNVMSSPTSNTFPAFSLTSNGSDWLVVGQGAGAGDGGVKGRRIAANGTFADASAVTLLPAASFLYFFVDAHAASGEYLVSYQDGVGMKGRRFSASLSPIGSAFVIPGSKLASNGSSYFITWTNLGNLVGSPMSLTGSLSIPAGAPLTSSFSVPWPGYAEATWDGTQWWASWFEVIAYGEYRVRAARVSAAGVVLDPNGVDLGEDLTSFATGLRCEGAPGGGVRAVWADEISVSEAPLDVRSAALDANAQPTGGDLVTTAPPAERYADAIEGPGGTRMIAWLSSHSGVSRIMAQRVSRYGAALDAEPIELASGPLLTAPAVAWDGTRYMVVWSNTITMSGRRVSADGAPIDPSPITLMQGFQPEVAGADGRFYAVCANAPSYPQNRYIFGRRFDGATGAPLDAGVLTIGGTFANYPDAIAVGDRWLVTWQSNYSHDSSGASAAASFVNADGSLGATVGLAASGYVPKAAVSSSGVVMAVYNSNSPANAGNDVVARRIAADGTVGPQFTVASAIGKQLHPSIAWNGSEFVSAWDDRRNQAAFYDDRTDIYGARITEAGTVVDTTGFAIFSDLDTAVLGGLSGSATGSVLTVVSTYEPAKPWSTYRLTMAFVEPDAQGDLTGDGTVDGADLAAFLGLWGGSDMSADFNGDEAVDANDLAILLAAWS
jgi:hypothetical protein